ncbi:MAG: metal-dependent transcriptional regulator [candidate division Zixibacteria bacterium]|nr:metal-dependent transcriptional regulator [candidate division Zixibacteria bacterium]
MIRLTAKDEDYLETIYRISKTSDTVGVTEVAKARKVTVPTARTAVARLAKDGLVRQQHYGKIILNPSGKKLGEEIFAVHRILRQFLTDALLIEPQLAEQEACRMEHGLSKTTLRRLRLFLEAITNCGGGDPKCLSSYRKELLAK